VGRDRVEGRRAGRSRLDPEPRGDADATIEVGTETIPVRATRILREGSEWERLYAAQVARRPGFAEYLEKTEGIRRIPVVVLERR
jgi:F420H(2)-dependent quinone reductase